MFLKYFKPRDVYEENIIVLNLMKCFTTFSLTVKNGQQKKLVFTNKYLIFPMLFVFYSISLTFYLPNFVTTQLKETFDLNVIYLLLQLLNNMLTLIHVSIRQFTSKEFLINVFETLDRADKTMKNVNCAYNIKIKKKRKQMHLILGFILFSVQWCWVFVTILYKIPNEMVFHVNSLFFVQNLFTTSVMYLYVSILHSINQRFSNLTKLLKDILKTHKTQMYLRKTKICILAKTTKRTEHKISQMIGTLLDMYDILEKLNSIFGSSNCRLIALNFVSIVTNTIQFVQLISNLRAGYSRDQFLRWNVAMELLFETFCYMLNQFIMFRTCEECTKKVSNTANTI